MKELSALVGVTETEAEALAIPSLEAYRLPRRFDRMGRLIGEPSMQRLAQTHVMVIGLGGVGSWAAESLARSGVGCVSLVDFDEICVTNSNRQIHALSGLVGSKKSEVMAARLQQIHPGMKVQAVTEFYNAETSEQIFSVRPDFVIDAIDNLTAKCHLLAFCRSEGIPVICSTGSGGRLDPSQVRQTDLALTEIDPLAREVRKILRQKHGFPSEGPFGIPAVYSIEPHRQPYELSYDRGKGFQCVCPQGDNGKHTCDDRNVILGTASFITGVFGLYCASWVVNQVVDQASL